MKIIQTDSSKLAVEDISNRIIGVLNAGKPLLWLVCGGSNIKAAVEAMNLIRSSAKDLGKITIGLTDERFGPVGHEDSNWKQLEDAGFDFNETKLMPLLGGKNLEETIASYASSFDSIVKELKKAGGSVIAMFGIGSDGHIAGILPGSKAAYSDTLVSGYEAGEYTRITLTFDGLRKIDSAYALVFGSPAKQEAIEKLLRNNISLIEQPSQILKEVSDSSLYTDLSSPGLTRGSMS